MVKYKSGKKKKKKKTLKVLKNVENQHEIMVEYNG